MIATPQLSRMAQEGTQQYQGCSQPRVLYLLTFITFKLFTRANFETKIELSKGIGPRQFEKLAMLLV